MAKRGRKHKPCPNVLDLIARLDSGWTAAHMRAHYGITNKTLLIWLDSHGLRHPPQRKDSNPVRTSTGRTWQALNTAEKLAAVNTPSQVERFWAKVQKSDGCWTWTGAIHKSRGYGQFGYGGFNMFAHRASWMINRGVIPADMWVLHHCDNPVCVRPDHLFLGSNQDNYDDRDAKNRVRHGSRHPRAKLTEALVIELRASAESDAVWAERMGMHPSNIRDARIGKKWKRVPGANPDFYNRIRSGSE